MRSVYILLTRTNSALSKAIGFVTKDSYTHVAISLDREMTKLYSFGRIYKRIPFVGGFVQEDINDGLYALNGNTKCAIYELKVSDSSYVKIADRIIDMDQNSCEYKFNFLGLINILIGKDFMREKYYFCSEFVTDILQKTKTIAWDKPPYLTKPVDFTVMDELKLVYIGSLKCAVV